MLKSILAISFLFFILIFSGIQFLSSQNQEKTKEKDNEETLKNLSLSDPIEPFLGFTSSFCEFRSTHLHGGLDFSTGQKNGANVIAVLDGEVREVKITYRGYGKALYLYHKNNLLSVYAHLSKFHPSIEEYLKPYYEKVLYPGTVSIKPPIKFNAGDVIAYSGESGEGFPHLHYELRLNNNPINPLPFFSFEKISKVIIGKLVITPESPQTSINGKYNKVFFHFPIKNKINITGPFSIGVEAYDFYNGNRRGIQKIELYLDNQIVNKISPDIYSFEDYYGVRFLYDGNFSRFSPIKLVYNLNPQEGNPYKFLEGKNYFVLGEGKHNFELIVYGANDKLSKKFEVNISKPPVKPFISRQNIFLRNHFFLVNQEGQFYPSSVKLFKVGSNEFYIGQVKPFEKIILPYFEIMHKEKRPLNLCLYLKNIFSESILNPLTPGIFIEPKDLGISKKIEISVNLKGLEEKEKVAIYRIRGNLYWGGSWEGDKLKAEVFAPEDYIVLKDNIPPSLIKVYKKNKKIYVMTKDVGSGIPWDGVKLLINNKEVILEYDPDHITAQGEIEEKGKGVIIVKDNAGNKTEKTFNF